MNCKYIPISTCSRQRKEWPANAKPAEILSATQHVAAQWIVGKPEHHRVIHCHIRHVRCTGGQRQQ